MQNSFLELDWPKDGLYVKTYAHRVMNYRFHRHCDVYELSILLEGTQEYCRGSEPRMLEPDDVILTNPGVGHAGAGRQVGTTALIVQFSPNAFKTYLKKGEIFDFTACLSDSATRNNETYRLIRRYAAMTYLNLCSGSPYSTWAARASASLLMTTLCERFSPPRIPFTMEVEAQQQIASAMLRFLETHYREKISLQDLADSIQYNRTYVSTLFKNTVGMNFHEYLTRIRFQNALLELATTDHKLTDIAMDNGFSDLKSMNATFREIICRSPADYRATLDPNLIVPAEEAKVQMPRYIEQNSESLRQKLSQYL